eukprot:7826336-Pyramimonas_sp.AAC.1
MKSSGAEQRTPNRLRGPAGQSDAKARYETHRAHWGRALGAAGSAALSPLAGRVLQTHAFVVHREV